MLNRRADGTLVKRVPAYRRIMPFLMKTRTESAVYFDLDVDLTETEEFLKRFNALHSTDATLFHLILWSSVRTLATHPRLNRFIAGGKLWQRKGIWLSYSAKKRLDNDSPVVVIKRRFDPDLSLRELQQDMLPQLREHRSDRPSYVDREMGVLLKLPALGLRAMVGLGRVADRVGLLPSAFIERDPLYSSFFVANLGSVGLDAAYHHLYEYGTIPIFCVIGKTQMAPKVVDGQVVPRRTVTLRFTYDERVEDGLYASRALRTLQECLEHPWDADRELRAEGPGQRPNATASAE